MKKLKIWIECARLRTLPVSLSGVIIAIGIALWQGTFRLVPAVLCVLFALLAQIVSNMANEYYDFLKGTDKPGRVGPRRGVTEGDITPNKLRNVTFALLVLDCIVGLCLLPYGGLWMLPVGIVIAIFALAYSAGPYPLSYHGLGEVAVFIFFGIVPVVFTYFVQSHTVRPAIEFNPLVFLASMSIGFMAVNVLLINNYRDVDDDRDANKRTSVVIFGRKPAAAAYLINGYVAMGLLSPLWVGVVLNSVFMPLISSGETSSASLPLWILAAPVVYLVMHTATWYKLIHRDGVALNPLLGGTARNMLFFTIIMFAAFYVGQL
ncbi:MAG: 1,4-dihydroxy-2-naphthoate octaprenyltransferase [Bacteroidales bacterium]|nr:1,4-dihydroxy-2-naphthoate octaprenyltransferase [Candidatus Sodaliphilus fimicaballi]